MRTRWNAALIGAVFAGAFAIAAPPARCRPQSQDQKPAEQKPEQQDTDSVAEAARKAKANKPKTETKKVYTTEDLATSRGAGGISVVGEKDSGANGAGADQANRALTKAGGATGGSGVSAAGPAGAAKGEAYWRGRAQALHDQMAQVDDQIAKLQDEIKKGGNSGFNVQAGLKDDTVFLEDRNTRMKKLQEKKDSIQKQIDALEDEARQADVPSSWIH